MVQRSLNWRASGQDDGRRVILLAPEQHSDDWKLNGKAKMRDVGIVDAWFGAITQENRRLGQSRPEQSSMTAMMEHPVCAAKSHPN
jgi:hypothetical protein